MNNEIYECMGRCGAFVPEDRQLCAQCSESARNPSDRTPDGVIRKYRPMIIRDAKYGPAKLNDQLAVLSLARIGLAEHLMTAADKDNRTEGERNLLVRAIAETRVLVEALAIIHCAGREGADAYRFHLETAARRGVFGPRKEG